MSSRVLPSWVLLLLLAGCATDALVRMDAGGGSGDLPGDASSCATQALPTGWPDVSSDDTPALLAPFLSCASPADFLALQQRVDMPRLVARLEAWSAVRLGTLGPVREDASAALTHQRALFLLQSLERYGPAYTDVLVLFVLDSCHDDDLRDLLFLLTQDKRLVELLEHLPSLGPALKARGFKPWEHAERDFQWSDVGRGLDSAGRQALATSPLVNGLQSSLQDLYALEAQLPPPYRQAFHSAGEAQRERSFSAGNLSLGFFDHMTFGVPLGLYGLVAGTSQGVQSLTQGRYEQAVRELAPAAVLVALYAGGKGVGWLSEARGLPGGVRGLRGVELMESRWRGLLNQARQVRELLGEQGARELAGYIRARRDAGRLVAVGGMDAALALHETRGDVARAQAMLSRAHPEAPGALKAEGNTRGVSQAVGPLAQEAPRQGGLLEHPATLAAWVDEQVGLTQEVVQTKLAAAELESTSSRLSKNVTVLERQRPVLESPPAGARGNPRWSEYVTYYEKRIAELNEGKETKGPLRWEAYEQLWGPFTRGLEFERAMVKLLRADAALPRAQRRFLGDFDKPRVEAYVGVKKPGTGLRFADVLVIEESELAGQPPRVETLSFKSRDFSTSKVGEMQAQILEDAMEALTKYGETLSIRRSSIQPLLPTGGDVSVSRVRLIYEGGDLRPNGAKRFQVNVEQIKKSLPGVEILFNESPE